MKRAKWVAFCTITLISLAALAPARLPVSNAAHATVTSAPIVIDFEDLATSGPTPGGPGEFGNVSVISQYASQGVTFNGPVALDYTKGSAISGFAHSGKIAIEPCYSQEFCATTIEMRFTSQQRRVKVWVGFRGRLNESRTVLLTGFDTSGAEVGVVSVSLPPSNASQSISTPLELMTNSDNIARAVVGFSPNTIFTNGLAVDDVEFDTAGPAPPCASSVAPTITLSRPATGSTVQINEFILQGEIGTTVPLDSANLFVFGSGGSRSHNLLTDESARGGGPFTVRLNDLLFPGLNTLLVEVESCSGYKGVIRTINFEPIAIDARFSMLGLEVTQSIQDLNNTVSLVAGKGTVARVYLRLSGSTSKISKVSGVLTGCRPLGDSTLCGDSLPFLYSLNTSDIDSSADITARRRDLNASLNFELPPDWLTEGKLHLRLSHLEIDGKALSLPCDGCDNPNPLAPFFSRFYVVRNAPTLRLRFVNVPYTVAGMNGGMPYLPRDMDFDLLASWLRRAYPTGNVDILPGRATTKLFEGRPLSLSEKKPSGGGFYCYDVNSTLRDMRSSDLSAGTNERVIYIGLVTDASGFFMQGCFNGGRVSAGPAGPSSGWDTDGSYADWYNAHELGHVLGRGHPWAGCSQDVNPDNPSDPTFPRGVCPNPREAMPPNNGCGHSPDDRGYPYPAPAPAASSFPFIGGPLIDPNRYFGFDLGAAIKADLNGDGTIGATEVISIPQQPYAPDSYTDMMGYCGFQWISNYTYEGILDRLHEIEGTSDGFVDTLAGSVEQILSDGLFVQGIINLTRGTITLQPFSRLPGLRATARPVSSSFNIDLLNSVGTLLARYPFEPEKTTDQPVGVDQIALLAEVVPYVAGTSRVVISKDGVEMASRTVTANAPQVHLLSPNGGDVLAAATATVTWEASDADNDPLSYSLLYSIDAGLTWRTLVVRLTQPNYQVNLTTLPGSQRALFRIIATDGVNTAMDNSDATFSVPLKNPQVSIIAPASQSLFATTQTIVFTGAASDLEDGQLDGVALQWSSDRQGGLGSSRSVGITGLMPGAHVITLEARDQSGAVGRESIQIQIITAAPIAHAGPDQQVISGSAVQLDGRNSRGVGNLTYQWTFLSKPTGSQATLAGASAAQSSFTGDVIGEYVVQLVVKDAVGAQAVDRTTATIACCALTIVAQQDTGAPLTASLNTMTPSLGPRTTPFSLSLPLNDRVSISAPAAIGNLRFLYWRSITNNRTLTTSSTLTATVNQSESVAAVYQLPRVVTFSVNSICEGCATGPVQFRLGINVITPALGTRNTPFNFESTLDNRAVLTAPASAMVNGRILRFKRWISVTDNRVITTHRTLSGFINKTETVAAVYQ